VRQLATTPGGDQYAALLRELFDLAVPGADDDLSRAVDVRPTSLDLR
jgi:glutamyl-tRNA reductase